MTGELHPLLRLQLELAAEHGQHQRELRRERRRLLERSAALAEYHLASTLRPDQPPGSVADWLVAVLDVAYLDLDPTDEPPTSGELATIRDLLLQAATPGRVDEFAALLALDDHVLTLVAQALRA